MSDKRRSKLFSRRAQFSSEIFYFVENNRTIDFWFNGVLNQYFVRWIPEHFAINIC